MKNTLISLATAATLSLSGCNKESDANKVEQFSHVTTPVQTIANNTTEITRSICDESLDKKEVPATKEQKKFWMQTHQKLLALLSSYSYKTDHTTVTPDGGTEHTIKHKNIEIVQTESPKGNYYDLFVPIESVQIEGVGYNEIHINIAPNASFGQAKFQNTNNTFPKLRFTLHTYGQDPGTLNLESRYYDEIEGMDLKTNSSQGCPTPFNENNFQKLVDLTLQNLAK